MNNPTSSNNARAADRKPVPRNPDDLRDLLLCLQDEFQLLAERAELNMRVIGKVLGEQRPRARQKRRPRKA